MMKEYRTLLSLAQDAYAYAGKAQELLVKMQKVNVPNTFRYTSASDNIHGFMSFVTEVAMCCSHNIEEQKKEMDASPVLQAEIVCGETRRKIVIHRPTGQDDDPYISETVYKALVGVDGKACLPIYTNASYDIAVKTKRGMTIARIESRA